MLQTILIIESVLFFVAAIFALVPWRNVLERWLSDNPTKAKVYVDCGEHIDPCNGRLLYAGVTGAFYKYRWNKVNLVVTVPGDYPFKFVHGRRKISVRAGHAISVLELHELVKSVGLASAELKAGQLAGADDIALATSANTQSAYDLNALIEGHVAVEVVRSLFGAKMKAWMVTIMVIAALVAGYFLFQQFSGQGNQVTPPPAITTPATTTPATGTIIPGGK